MTRGETVCCDTSYEGGRLTIEDAHIDGVRCPSCGRVFDSAAAAHHHSAWCDEVIVVAGGNKDSGDSKTYHTSTDCRAVPGDPDGYRSVDPDVLSGHYRECRRPECGDDYPPRDRSQGPTPATILRQTDPGTPWQIVAHRIAEQCEVICDD